jgi:hypothetical protein
MIIVRLQGGLGNQMFQYAMGRSVAIRNNAELKVDLTDLLDRGPDAARFPFREFDLDIFDLKVGIATPNEVKELTRRFDNGLLETAARRILGPKKNIVNEPHYNYSEAATRSPDGVYLKGYWQSPKYFAAIEPVLRREFTFKEEMTPKAQELHPEIRRANSVCLSVRRGDYLNHDLLPCYGVDYFQRADEVLRQKLSDYSYYVFSDDIEWCKANLKFEVPTTFVSEEYSGRKYQDKLRLMSACRHFVIPNSSYVWWAVWFNTDADKMVIAPKAWFTDPSVDTSDLIPETWIRI